MPEKKVVWRLTKTFQMFLHTKVTLPGGLATSIFHLATKMCVCVWACVCTFVYVKYLEIKCQLEEKGKK
jgi:hypothetical protein